MTNVVIAGYARSPFHLAGKGDLARVRPDDLAAQTIRGLLEKTKVDPSEIEDIILGCAFPEGEQGLNVARMIGLLADLPLSVGGMTVNRFCGSSMSAIHIAVGQINIGAGDAFICAGLESMSRLPMGGYNPLPNPELFKKSAGAYMGMGETAENVARNYQITRAEQDAFAVKSQDKAAAARADGRLADEIVTIKTKAGEVSQDGTIREGTTAEALAGLKPAFSSDGSVTAGTSSPLTDGASAVLVTSEEFAQKHGLTILARIKSVAVSGNDPETMGLGPIYASKKALERAGITVADLDIVEINEAFASQAIACIRDLGLKEETINLDGGAIAIGHPLGATGARIVGKAAALLSREGGRYALATQCIGGGQGIATVLERAIMIEAIKKVCVIGAGVMGAGIAAHVANAGIPVLLLDIVPRDLPEGGDRDAVAKSAVAKMLKTDPAPFMSKGAARLVETGNIDDHLGRVAECDWIVEAIVERLDIKQALYAKLEALKRPGTAVSSNTSTIPLGHLVDGRSDQFKADFLITHFFNPPRYMRLIEIVRGAQTDAAVAGKVEDFVDRFLGKRIVRAKDTPGFIANRIGTYWLAVAINAAMDQGITIEQADQIGGRPMGVPKTGIFGLVDLVGVDLMPLLSKSLSSTLPAGDPYFDTVRPMPLVDKMIADGFTGRKGNGGFYRFDKATRTKLSLDLATGEYRPEQKPADLPGKAEKDLSVLIDTPGAVGTYAWTILGSVLSYAAMLVGEAADDVVAIDDAMKLGYNWKFGPFELIDRMGPGKLAERLAAEGRSVPAILTTAGDRPFYRIEAGQRQYLTLDGSYIDVPRAEGVVLLEDIKLRSQPLLTNSSASLWDVGDGVAALEFHTKMNALDDQVIALIEEAIPLVEARFKALVVYNEGSNFSAGANLGAAMFAVSAKLWDMIEATVAKGQAAYKALKYAPFPVVSAPAGLALGGGCEILLHSDAIQAHAETYAGLVECGVGLVPGWGGNGEMMDRWTKSGLMPKGPMPVLSKVFQMISTAQVAKSAAEAREMLILRKDDGITMNRDRLLADAKAKALALAEGYVAPEAPTFRLAGESGLTGLDMAVADFHKKGMATGYDRVVSHRLGEVLTGGEADLVDTVTEQDLLDLERAAFLESVKDERTQARIVAMLTTGKPLRN